METNLQQRKNYASRYKDIPLQCFLLPQRLFTADGVIRLVGDTGSVDLTSRPSIAERMCAGAAGGGDFAMQVLVVLGTVYTTALILQCIISSLVEIFLRI